MKDSQLFLGFAMYSAINQKPLWEVILFIAMMVYAIWRTDDRGTE